MPSCFVCREKRGLYNGVCLVTRARGRRKRNADVSHNALRLRLATFIGGEDGGKLVVMEAMFFSC